MALTFADTHNMIAYLTKSDVSEEFNQIIDFLNASAIKKKVIITEATVREALRLDDAKSIDCLPNEEIFTELSRMGLVRNVDRSSKFYMYPRFLQMMIRALQADDVADEVDAGVDVDDVPAVDAEPTLPSPTHTIQPPPPLQELPSTSYVISTPPSSPIAEPSSPSQQQQPSQPTYDAAILLDLLHTLLETCTSLTRKVEALDQDKVAQALEITKLNQRVKKLERNNKLKVSGLKRLGKVGTTQRVESSANTVMDDQEDASKQREIIANIDVDEDVTLKDVAAVEKTAEIEKNTDVQGRPEEETKEQLEEEESKALKRTSESLEEKAAKTQIVPIVPNDDDDVYTEATPLALKVPVVDYEIYSENKKPFYKIIRADGSHQLFMSFLSLLRNFNRKDLEVLWKLVKERFSSLKPKNFSDDFLLTTLTYMFEKPDVQAQVWKNQRSFAEVHEGFGFGDRNEEGCMVLEFPTAHYLVVANSFFKKRDSHLITFQSGGHNTQIDYLLVRRGDLKACKDCRAFPATKQSRFKDLLSCSEGNQEDIDGAKERYKVAKREVKIAVAKSKDKVYEDLYKKLDSKEGTPSEESRPEGSGEVGRSSSPAHFDCNCSRINHEEVRAALQKMGRNKAVGPDQIPIEAWRGLGDEGVKWLTCLFNKIFSSAKMPNEWRLSEVIPVYKNKGDAQACSNYRENQFGFMPGRSTTEEIHLLRSLMKKYRERQRDLHMAFLDLEKDYDSVPCELVWKTLLDKGIPKRYSRVIKDMYEGAKTRVPTTAENTEYFPVNLGLHQGSAISPYLFTLILDELSRGIQEYDIVLIAESAERLNNILESWRKTLEDNGLRGGGGKIENAEVDLRRPQSAPVRRVEAMVVEGSRRMSRPKLRWEDRLKMDMKELRLSEDMTSDRNLER
nr:hypothetical protein [Tanacetum cinerariifolium]